MALEVKGVRDLAGGSQKTYDHAVQAFKNENHPYACEMLRELLRREPGCSEARQTLREVQLTKVGHKADLLRCILAFLKTLPHLAVTGPFALIRKQYSQALDKAEQILTEDPTSLPSILFFSKIAEMAGLQKDAIYTLEIGLEYHANNKTILERLARLYESVGQATKALQALQQLHELMPKNSNLESQIRRMTAQAAMEEGQWEQAGSYRDVLRDSKRAEELEREESGAARAEDAETVAKQIESVRSAIEESPQDAGQYRKLAKLYHSAGEYEKAIETYNQINEVTGTVDPTIVDAVTDVLKDQYDAKINELSEKAKEDPERQEELNSQIAELRKERDDEILKELRARVKSFPNEVQYRYSFAVKLWETGELDAALKEFQQLQRNRRLAAQVHLYMARIFSEKNMPDFSVEHFEKVLEDRESLQGSQEKETLYELAGVYERRENNDKALETLKRLYDLDVSFRDVSEWLQRYYGSESPSS